MIRLVQEVLGRKHRGLPALNFVILASLTGIVSAAVLTGGCGGDKALSAALNEAATKPTPTPTPPPSTFTFPSYVTRFETNILLFEQQDQRKFPPKGAVVFIGSSTVVGWKTLVTDFRDVTTINRGFGGSTMPEAAYYAYRIVTPYAPSTIVIYEGDNDLVEGNGLTPEDVLAAFQEFVTRVRAQLPKTRIIALSIKPSPGRWEAYHEQEQKTNQLMSDWIASKAQPNVIYVNDYNQFLGTDGLPNPDLYITDNVHLNDAGYRIMVANLKKYL